MYIVFDIGGTKTRLANSSDGLTFVQSLVFPTPKVYSEGIALLRSEIGKLAEGSPIDAIAGGVPATLNESNTEIVLAPNLPDWSDQPLISDLRQTFNSPVQLENDASLGALGEATLGAGKNFDSVVYLAFGTGIGGALVKNKQLDPLTRSFEPGHHVLKPSGPACPSDKTAGHWEAYLGQNNFTDTIALGILHTLEHWPAEVVVLGGGVTLHSNWNLDFISEQLKKLLPETASLPKLCIAELGDKAGLYGALEILNRSRK